MTAGVDVAILEVGLGGRLDATNVVRRPVITAVTRLDYDHVQVLGDTLTLIAGEKAGIFKRGVPCVTTPQEEEAMAALKERAAATEIPLLLAPSVDDFAEAGAQVVVGLEGEHHEINAACAVALCNGWLLRHAETAALPPLPPRPLPADPAATPAPHPVPSGGSEASELFVVRPEFRAGLEACASNWYGRSQVLDYAVGGARVTMLLDGAHTPDSMRAMGQWYDDQQAAEGEGPEGGGAATVLLFFCGAEREPNECAPTPFTPTLLPTTLATFSPSLSWRDFSRLSCSDLRAVCCRSFGRLRTRRRGASTTCSSRSTTTTPRSGAAPAQPQPRART